MNYSTMSRLKWFVLTSLLTVTMLVSLLVPISAKSYGNDADNFIAGNEQENHVDDITSEDMLLVYENGTSADCTAQVEAIAESMAYLGRAVDYGDWSSVRERAGEYNYVVFYNIKNPSPEMLLFCTNAEKHCLFIGTEFVEKYLNSIGKSNLITESVTGAKAVMDYKLSAQKTLQKQFLEVSLLSVSGEERSDFGVLYSNGEEYSIRANIEGISYIQLTDFQSEEARVVLINELVWWMWPYSNQPKVYSQYLVIDEIYPFMQPKDLLEKVDILIERNVPYVLSVMPITENTDYPAMKEFCQVLAYAQANGAMIVMHAPIIHKNNVEIKELQEKLTAMTRSYTQNGVYPLAIEVPKSWLYDETYLLALRRYSTVFIYDDGKESGFSLDTGTIGYMRQGHNSVFETLKVDETGMSYIPYYSNALYFPVTGSNEEMLALVNAISESSQSVANMMRMKHSVWLNDGSLLLDDGLLYVDDVQRSLKFVPYEFEKDYDYKENIIEKISLSLESQNRYLIIATVVAIVLFTMFIVLTRIQSRRSFFYADTKYEEDIQDTDSDKK